MKIRLLVILFYLFFVQGYAQNENPPESLTPEIQLDSIYLSGKKDSVHQNSYSTDNVVFPKKLKPDFRSKYKGEEFDYNTVKPRESLWERLQKRIKRILESIFGEMNPLMATQYAVNILRFLLFVICGVVLYFVLRFILSKNGNFFFSKKNKGIKIESGDLHENIHEINFTESIAKFEAEKDYRSAIRNHFLYVLKKLNDKKILEWNPEKTNKDYILELKNSGLKGTFEELVHIFNYVWYGEFHIDESSYLFFKKKFLDFKI